jgi:DNA-binding HxlR family transcriptional regulator
MRDVEHLRFNVFDARCPSREAFEHVTSKWGALTLGALSGGPLRFGALRRAVGGVSDRMLSQTLSRLERDGLVHREDHHTNPPHVEYSLTPAGRDVAERIVALVQALEGVMPSVMRSQGATSAS